MTSSEEKQIDIELSNINKRIKDIKRSGYTIVVVNKEYRLFDVDMNLLMSTPSFLGYDSKRKIIAFLDKLNG